MADIAPPSMDEASSTIVSISAKIMVLTIIVLVLVVAFGFFLSLYAKWTWSTNEEDPTIVTWRRRMAHQGPPATAVTQRRRGLDPLSLRSLPITVYNPKDFKDGLECSVCLCEVLGGEKTRVLPKCNHGFHVDCIDMWFQSHSTCPLCRNPVISSQNPSNNPPNNNLQETIIGNTRNSSQSQSNDHDGSYESTNTRELDANVESSSSLASSSSVPIGGLVIEIPRELCEDCSGEIGEEDEVKSPVMRRLRSLKRLLSRGKRVAPSPRGSTSGDVDQI